MLFLESFGRTNTENIGRTISRVLPVLLIQEKRWVYLRLTSADINDEYLGQYQVLREISVYQDGIDIQ